MLGRLVKRLRRDGLFRKGLGDRGGDIGAWHAGVRADQRQCGIIIPGDGEQVRVGRRVPGCSLIVWWRKSSPACRSPRCCWWPKRRARHRVHRGRRHPPARGGSDSPFGGETPGWHRAAGLTGNQDAHRQQIEQRLVAPAFAARGRLGTGQPVRLFAVCSDVSAAGGRSTTASGTLMCRLRRGCRFRFRVARILPGEFVEGVVLDRRQHQRFRFANGPKRDHVPHISWAFPRMVPNRFVVKSLSPSARAVQGYRTSHRALRAGRRQASPAR